MRRAVVETLVGAALAALFACSSSGSSGDSSADASTSASDGGDGAIANDASGGDAGARDGASSADVVSSTDVQLDPADDVTNYNDCTPFDFASSDHTAPNDPRVITFPFDPNPAQYQPRCMKIRVGQTITWKGDFKYHPLGPAGGDVPSPITADPSPGGTERAITFPNGGFFGFECIVHEAPAMYGAIVVVP